MLADFHLTRVARFLSGASIVGFRWRAAPRFLAVWWRFGGTGFSGLPGSRRFSLSLLGPAGKEREHGKRQRERLPVGAMGGTVRSAMGRTMHGCEISRQGSWSVQRARTGVSTRLRPRGWAEARPRPEPMVAAVLPCELGCLGGSRIWGWVERMESARRALVHPAVRQAPPLIC
jgi:hypothetical protein